MNVPSIGVTILIVLAVFFIILTISAMASGSDNTDVTYDTEDYRIIYRGLVERIRTLKTRKSDLENERLRDLRVWRLQEIEEEISDCQKELDKIDKLAQKDPNIMAEHEKYKHNNQVVPF